MKPHQKAEFWAKIDKGRRNECWEWTGGIDTRGYGKLWWGKICTCAHRVAWTLANKQKFPPKHVLICHHCDNKICCNPKHLYKGTYWHNIHDAINRNRMNPPRGERSPFAKLTAKQALQIRRSVAHAPELSDKYGVSTSVIYTIWHRKAWAHLPYTQADKKAEMKRRRHCRV